MSSLCQWSASRNLDEQPWQSVTHKTEKKGDDCSTEVKFLNSLNIITQNSAIVHCKPAPFTLSDIYQAAGKPIC